VAIGCIGGWCTDVPNANVVRVLCVWRIVETPFCVVPYGRANPVPPTMSGAGCRPLITAISARYQCLS